MAWILVGTALAADDGDWKTKAIHYEDGID